VKIIWFAVFLWSVVWAAYRSIGVIAGLAVVFMVINLKMWGDIWTYSSFVAEQPAVFGIAFVVFGFGLAFDWFASGCKTRRSLSGLVVARLRNEGRTGDQHDAFCIAAWLARADREGTLAGLLKPDLSPAERAVAQVEGWILGVPGLIRRASSAMFPHHPPLAIPVCLD
jgi:hypothetical protein